jgi:hypothetical protein
VHERSRYVRERGQIDIALRLASATFDLKPWVGTVDGLIDGRAGIDRAAIAPHAFIPGLASEVVRASPSARFSAYRSAKMCVMARDFESSFVRALRSPPDSGR